MYVTILYLCTLLLATTSSLLSAEESRLLHMAETPDLKLSVTNDGVMGGLSQGSARITEAGVLRFSGVLSLENNGGFSSVWFGHGSYDLSGAEGMEIRVKGDGRAYHLQLETDARYRGEPVSFRAEFETEASEWITARIPFSALTPRWRGRKLRTPFDPSQVETFGLILLEKRPGPFRIEVEWVGVY